VSEPRGGTYAERHRAAPAALRWSHGARFRAARMLVEPYAGARLLDYGCGDGTFLHAVGDLFPVSVGAELDPFLVEDAARRFGPGGPRFVEVGALADEPDGAFPLIVCMEVLEHCTPPAVDAVLALLRRLLAPRGRLLVSVPVETGPALLAKQAVRALAALRGVEGYRDRERYAPSELLRMLWAGPEAAIPRPVYQGRFADGSPNPYHGHKGFNWRALRERMRRDFIVESVRCSPFPRLPAGLNSQAWMLCAPR
jgi:SAM-dependent methyltransferase